MGDRFILFISLWLFPFFLSGQTLTVKSKQTGNPIPNVLIFNLKETKSVTTDSLGQADISVFSQDEHMVISHTAYHVVVIKKRELFSTDYIFYLNPAVINLEEFVVAANKRPQKLAEVPNEVTVISPKEIHLVNPQTSADMLASTGKIFVQKSQMGGGSPMIRGFAANRVLIVVDGVRMNNAIFRSGNLQNIINIDPNYLGKSEVVFGPGSVIYGSDALGGVMDFYTFEPVFSSDDKLKVKGDVLLRYAYANNERTGHFHIALGTKKFSSVTSGSFSKFGNLLMGNGAGPEEYLRDSFVETANSFDQVVQNNRPIEQVYTGYSAWNILQKFAWKASDKLYFDYRFIFSNTSDIPRYDRLIISDKNNKLKYARWDYGPQWWMMNNAKMTINMPNGAFDNLNLTVAWQKFKESRFDRKLYDVVERQRKESVDMVSVNLDFDNEISGRTFLYYGYEGVFNLVHSQAKEVPVFNVPLPEKPIQTRYPDGSSTLSNAAYINLKFNRDEHTTVVLGMRYTHINLRAELDTTFYRFEQSKIKSNTGALTGSIGIAHRPKGNWQINANLASGFRAPNIDDIAKVFDSEPGRVIVPNPDLQSEYLYSIDFLIGKGLGKAQAVKLELSGFLSYLVNAMVRGDFTVDGKDSVMYDGTLSKIQAVVNTGSAYVFGTSFSVVADLTKRFQITGDFTYTYGEDDNGNHLRHVPPMFGALHLIYRYKMIKLDAFGIYNGEISYQNLAPSEKDKPYLYAKDQDGNPYSPWWYTINFRAALTIGDHIELTAGVTNILDIRYRPYSSGIAAAGRNYILSLRAFI